MAGFRAIFRERTATSHKYQLTFASDMRLVVFLIVLFLTILGLKVKTLAAGKFQSSCLSISLNMHRLPCDTFSNSNFRSPSLATSKVNHENEILLCEAIEEEEQNDFSSIKLKAAAANYCNSAFLTFSNPTCKIGKEVSFLTTHFSHKYIVQCALRI